MPGAGVDDKDLVLLAQWFVREVGPRLSNWVDGEGLVPSARALQTRANRARAIGEVDEYVHAFLIMHTDGALRWCWAEGLGQDRRAFVKPDGEIVQTPEGHVKWATENMDNLVAQGLVAPGTSPMKISAGLVNSGWVVYAVGYVISEDRPNPAQTASLNTLISEVGAPEGFDSVVFSYRHGNHTVKVEDVRSQGLDAALGQDEKIEHQADMGGGADGPSQQGDGCDVDNNFMTTVQDGSTAPFERSYRYMKQDFAPEVWWSRQLLDYLKHNFPGKKDVGGPEPDSGSIPSATGPGQQFANSVRTVLEASRRVADATDPSDTDGQHDQLNEDSTSTHLLDPASVLYKKQRGLGAPSGDPGGGGDGEMRTRLGARTPRGHDLNDFPTLEFWLQKGIRRVRFEWNSECCEDCLQFDGGIISIRDLLSGKATRPHLGCICRLYRVTPDEEEDRDTVEEIPILGQHEREEKIDSLLDQFSQEQDIEKKRQIEQRLRSLRASFRDRWRHRRSDKGVEQQIIQMEKEHLGPQQIARELRSEGVPTQVIDETYDQRDKNLIKTVEVTL